MTSYVLNTNIINPISKNLPRQAVVLCHGYGGDGNDISTLAINWQRFLPDAVFLCPNAPEICSVSPKGYQWFDLEQEKEKVILEKSIVAEKKLNFFLDQVLSNYNLKPDNLALVGFSQGCMMIIQTALKKSVEIKCLLGFSGKVINQKHLGENIISKPKIFLMHGENDTIVSPTHLLEAKEFLNRYGLNIKTKLFKDCGHHISVDSISLGLEFLKKNLL